MQNKELQITKKRLAIVFAIIVFLIAFILEIVYFSLKYQKLLYIEKKDFNIITYNFNNQLSRNPRFLDNFINNSRFRSRGSMMRGNPFRFLDFVLVDKSGKIVFEKLNYSDFYNIDFLKFNYDQIYIKDGILIKKINIKNHKDYFDIIFFKKQFYSINDYLNDLFFFFVLNLIFSLFFYFIGIYFVGKNLKPIDEMLNDMTDFIHNANHELKTPISVISSNLQLLKVTKTYEEYLVKNCIDEIKRIDSLLKELSNLSDIKYISQKDLLDLKQEINEIIKEYKNEITEKNINLKVNFVKNITLKANKNHFYIMFGNLLKNAIKHNFKSGEINITLNKNKLIISNSGEKINKEDLIKIFDRFFKGKNSNNTDGFGIGLSLVKKICDIYDWEIKVFSDDNLTTFEVKF